ncbi:unnamed protein product, partial [Phaedon cochleariae]
VSQQLIPFGYSSNHQSTNQIAPAAKKLWGFETKDATSKLALNHEGVWRDPTWAAPEHNVSASLAMGRRPGGGVGGGPFTAGGNGDPTGGGILSPRGSDNGGLGVKMVEYVLGTSPTGKDSGGGSGGGLEPRMRALHLPDDKESKEMGKQPASQGSPSNKEECNGGGGGG